MERGIMGITAAPQVKQKYKSLGDVLLRNIGDTKTQSWLAEETFVSQTAVHWWLIGKCRPKPDRLGHIAALLRLQETEIIALATLAGYDANPEDWDKLLNAYRKWCSQQDKENMLKLLTKFKDF